MAIVHGDQLFRATLQGGPQIVQEDRVLRVAPGTSPDYDRGNSLLKLLQLVERTRLAAEREHYLHDSLQHLFPFRQLDLYGPQSPDTDNLDPARQDNKTDFQKQNVADFVASDTTLVRGWAAAGDWVGPFLRASYRGGPDSFLSEATGHRLGESLKLWIKVGARVTPALLDVPYNAETDRYEIELWGYEGPSLTGRVGARGRDALARGELVVSPALVPGQFADFNRDGLDDQLMALVAPENAMHPIRPLHVEMAWADGTGTVWDSLDGANYHYEFNMVVRGWDHYLGVGISPNPHGGIGFLEYRNLLSNYGRYAGSSELGRTVQPWNFDAFGRKEAGSRREEFLAVEYMDLHILKPGCGIGLHRHRDNQEAFLMMEGRGYMVVGDWCQMPQRERSFEVRTLRAGHFALLKGGNLHGLMNATDEDISLFMFGGYD
jgi:mannose-6-phosphate isomerase-like protein (cupin superfamily)